MELTPIPNLDMAPFAFALTGLVMAWALLRLRLLDLVPVARHAVFENMVDIAIVLDGQDRIVDLNRAAERAIGCTARHAIGRPADQVLPDWSRLAEEHQADPRPQREICLEQDGSLRHYDLNISPLHDGRGQRGGRLLVLRDITASKRSEVELRAARDELEVRVQERTAQLQSANEDLEQELAEHRRTEDALRISEANLRKAQLVANVGSWVWHIQSNQMEWSEQMYRIFGIEQDDDAGNLADVIFQAAHPDDRALLEQARLSVINDGQPVPLETRITRPDHAQRVVWVEAGELVLDEAGNPALLTGITQDITDRKQEEQALLHTAEELQRSNVELEQLAYIASHDLQEPLRMVTSYLQLLERRYKGHLDADADEFIHFAVDGASRMKRLIVDLLAYSRVGTRGQEFTPTDLEAVLDQVTANLEMAIADSDAQISHDSLPTVMADASQMVQLLQNLIGNAIKFQGEAPPRIHVGARRQQGAWLFSVQDNGIGIDPAFSDRLFVIFQRLHSNEEYPGTGIGLAVCKKIMERHGGRIWLESQPGQGTTFFSTVPLVCT